MPLHVAERSADGGDAEHADQHGAGHAAAVERDHQRKAGQREQRAGLAQRAERDQRRRAADDETGVAQRDEREEQPDAGGDAELQRARHRVDQPFAHRQQAQYHKGDTGDEHAAERGLPARAVALHDDEGEEGVQAHAGRERHRIVREQPHRQRAECCRQARGDEHRAEIHVGLGQDRRVQEHDVGHRQERRAARENLRAHAGAMASEIE